MDLLQDDWVEDLKSDDNAVILDVRTEDEVNQGRIANSINIDFLQGETFLEEVDKLDKSKNYYVYCRSGARSANACATMNQLGFENTYNLVGGILQWEGELV